MIKTVKILILFIFFIPGCITWQIGNKISPLEETIIKKGSTDRKILLINIDGPIFEGDKTNVFGNQTEISILSRIKEELDKASEDKKIKAIILKLNTPGGAVTTCDIIQHEILSFKRKTGIPVIAEMGDVCASGGVYISTAADKIIAHPTTVTGSIGVIAYTVNLKELLDKIGIKSDAIKSGDKKDMGSILRPMTEKERALLQEVINTMYEKFLTVIIEGRKINEKKLREIADGRVFTANKALEYGLIDKIGYSEDTISIAENTSNINDATIVTYVRPGNYTPNYFSSTNLNNYGTVNFININSDFFFNKYGIKLMYMWVP